MKKPGVPMTTADPAKKRLREGLNNTIAFTTIIAATYDKMKKRGEIMHDQGIELVTVVNACRKVLFEFFKVPPAYVENLVRSLDARYIEDKSEELRGKMNAKLVVPGAPGAGAGGVVLATKYVDIAKIRREFAPKKI